MNITMEKVRAHLYISGKVQGVFYRSSARAEASGRGLVGWVKNLSDGRVEVLIEGSQGKVQEMIQWCSQGPPSAQVSNVDIQWEAPKGDIQRFEITR